jgi:uncharacterized protein involved in exopolysaccharide biosynthesis
MSVLFGLLAALERRRLLIVTLFALLAIGAVAGAYLQRPSYEAHAKVLLDLGGRPISLSRAEVPMTVAVQTVEALTTLSEVFSSRDLVERLVDRVGPEAFESPPPANPIVRRALELVADIEAAARQALASAELVEPQSPREELVEAIEERLSIHPVRQSQVIEVSFAWRNPSVPPLVLRNLLEIYVDRVNLLNAQTAEQTVLTDQAENARLVLEEAQAHLRELRQSTEIVDPVQERQALTERIERLAPLLGYAEAGEADGVAIGGREGPGGEIAALRRQLNELRIERAGALAQYTADSPAVRAVDAQIAAAKDALARERTQIAAALAADRHRLEQVLDAESRFADAYRAVDLAAEAYSTYQKAANDRQVMRLADEELRIKTIDVPAALAPASGASRLVVLIAGIAAAAILACLVGLFVDRLRTETGEDADGEEPGRAPHAARLVRDLDDTPALRASVAKR